MQPLELERCDELKTTKTGPPVKHVSESTKRHFGFAGNVFQKGETTL
jgi:hypothetical protein